MKNTVIIVSHNRPIADLTLQAIKELAGAGALFLRQQGTTDVTLARNLALSGTCIQLRADPSRDTVLMVDDDMVFTVEQAQELVDYSRGFCVAASAMYATAQTTLAATRLQTPAGKVQRWVTGLGLLAIPALALLELEQRSEPFITSGRTNYGFTWSMASGGQYWSEDFTLCRRLGGVHLLPLAVGHLKMWPLYPDDHTVESIRTGRALPGMPELPSSPNLPRETSDALTAFAAQPQMKGPPTNGHA